MANWIDVFSAVNDGYNNGRQPLEIFSAVITSVNPLSLNLGDNHPVESEIIKCCSNVQYLKNTADVNEIGTNVVVIKALGGQTFFIIDKAGENETAGITQAEIIDVNPIKIKLCNNKIYDDKMLVFTKDLQELKTTTDKSEIGKKFLVTRSCFKDEIYILSRLEE